MKYRTCCNIMQIWEGEGGEKEKKHHGNNGKRARK
jgi:hypothetical protein